MTDFHKAFDRIDHTIAIQKIISFGVKPTLIRWIADFLTERTQCLRYRGVTSEWVTLKAGVPQGTKLGPIVFLIVINNALRDSNIAYWKYVDDVTVYQSYETALNLLNMSSFADRRKELCLSFAEKLISNEKVSYLIPPCKNIRSLHKSNTREQLNVKPNDFVTVKFPT